MSKAGRGIGVADEGNGLLAHLTLSGWFTNSIEPIATQSLAYILARSASARRAVQETVLAGGADVDTIEYVLAEATGGDGARPDLACYDHRGPNPPDAERAERVLIENKFWANLTERQPNTYLRRLAKADKPCTLLFVAPEARIRTLWPEVCGLAETIVTLDVDMGISLKSVLVRDNTYMMATSWGHLLDRMADSGEETLLGDIHQLQVLCRKMDIYAPGEPPELTQLIDEAAKYASSKGYLSTGGLLTVRKEHGYGRYIRIGPAGKPGGGTAWFGVNSNLKDQHEESLWLMFVKDGPHPDLPEVRRRLAPLYPTLDGYVHPGWDGPNVPIPLPVDIDGYEARRDAVVERMGEIAALLSDTA